MKINLFVLAAGFGERLRPITEYIPKPLLPILGKPAIERVIERFPDTTVQKIGINAHYMADEIKNWADKSPFSQKISFYHEKTILGTGGALKNAANLLSGSVFIVHNADIISDIDLPGLLEFHCSAQNLITLAVHDHSDFSNVWIDDAGRPMFIGKDAPTHSDRWIKKAFTGIAVYSPQFLTYLPEGESNVVNAWLKASGSGARVGTMDVTGCRWNDIGSPEAYSAAIFDELSRDGETVYIGPAVDCSKVQTGQYTVIEDGSKIDSTASLKRTILLPGSSIKDETVIEDSICGPGYRVRIPEASNYCEDILGTSNLLFLKRFFTSKAKASLIGAGGSDRKYYRISEDDKTMVLMKTAQEDPDFERQIAFTGFFRKRVIPVPELIDLDVNSRLALFEDLGDVSLYTWLKCRKDPVQVEDMYRKVLDILVLVHSSPDESLTEYPMLRSRVFDHDHLRWETDYFMERYVNGICGLEIDKSDPVMEEFERLSEKVASFEKTLVHRDFQSQNIMVTKGGLPGLIDYQGARIGPAAYDLASILFDPYYRLGDEMRSRLIDYYLIKRRQVSGREFDKDRFRLTLLPCCLQRHMQALGAYGYLSKEKGKAYFLKFTPQALSYLTDEVRQLSGDYPLLYKLVLRLHETA